MPDIFARKRIFYLTLNRLAGQHRAAYSMEIYAKAPPPLSRKGRENSVAGWTAASQTLSGPFTSVQLPPFRPSRQRYIKIVGCWAHRNNQYRST